MKGVYDDGIADVEKDYIDEVVEEIKGCEGNCRDIIYENSNTRRKRRVEEDGDNNGSN